MSSPQATRSPVGATVTADQLEDDPHPVLARLRASEPVSWVPALDGWLVTRHDLATAVLRDARTFTVDDPRFSTAQVIGASMLSLDGREHTRHRDAFAKAFRPEETRRRFTAAVESEAARLVAALRPVGAADLRASLAGPLAVSVLTTALGLGDADVSAVRQWYDTFVHAVSDITAGRQRSAAADDALAELSRCVRDTLRAGEPDSLLVGATRGPDELSTPEVVSNAAVLMFGGIDTTEGMIANAALHLLRHPDVLTRVRSERSLLDAAIEESVRLEPSAAVVDRYATRDIALGRSHIRAGDLVIVSLAAANRDPEVFADPDRFDPDRTDLGRHLAFARGPHFCFGAHLARLETRTALGELLDQLPGLRLDDPRAPGPRGLIFRKPPRVPARWERLSPG